MINSVVLMGRLTYEPELRSSQSGKCFTNIQIAADRDYKSDGERKTDFIDCIVWGKQAEFVKRYFHKGSMIAVTGGIQTENYTDSKGDKRKSVTVNVSSVSFAGEKMTEAAEPITDETEYEEIE